MNASTFSRIAGTVFASGEPRLVHGHVSGPETTSPDVRPGLRDAACVPIPGKEGPVGLMPPVGQIFTDEQIASVLTYVRREWGQTADPVDATAVTAVRSASAGRTRPWTEAELSTLSSGGRGGRR